jgi:hypothetical protein
MYHMSYSVVAAFVSTAMPGCRALTNCRRLVERINIPRFPLTEVERFSKVMSPEQRSKGR